MLRLFFAICLWVTGSNAMAVTDYNSVEPSIVQASVKSEFLEYAGLTVITGPSIISYVTKGTEIDGVTTNLLHEKGNGLVVTQIVVQVIFSGDWRTYSRAHLKGGAELNVGKTDRAVHSCTDGECVRWERLWIDMSLDQLKAYRGSEIDLAVWADGEFETPTHISANYVQGFLDHLASKPLPSSESGKPPPQEENGSQALPGD